MSHILTYILLLAIPVLHCHAAVPPGASTGYMIIDLSAGTTVAAHNEHKAFIPASTLKCITSAAALSALGAGFTFDTYVSCRGFIAGDTLVGDMIISPSGDPSLDTGFAREIADTIPFNTIAGNICVPGLKPYPHVNPSCMIEDIGTEYGVGWSRFNYCGNRALVNETMTQVPTRHLVDDFIADMIGCGVTACPGDSTCRGDSIFIHRHTSSPLSSLCRHAMTESDNLYAESVGRALSPSLDINDALDSIRSFCSRCYMDSFRIDDMSGLARTNLMTPHNLASVLKYMAQNEDYVGCFPAAGRDGTVKRLLKGTRLQGRLRLKSGSMSGVLCYAGYRINSSGRPTHAVVIMVNNFLCKHSVAKRYIEQWLLKNF